MAIALAKAIGHPSDELKTCSPEECVVWMRKNLPDLNAKPLPRCVTPNVKMQKRLCANIAEVIGDGPDACAKLNDVASALGDDAQLRWSEKTVCVQRMIDNLTAAVKFLELAEAGLRGTDSAIVCAKLLEKTRTQLADMEALQKKTINTTTREMTDLSTASTSNCVLTNESVPFGGPWSKRMSKVLSRMPDVAEMITKLQSATAAITTQTKKTVDELTTASSEPVRGGGLDEVLKATTDLCNALENNKPFESREPTFCASKQIVSGGVDHALGGISVESRIKKQTSQRALVLQEFRKKARALFDRMLSAVSKFGQKMGHGQYQLSDDLCRFVDAFTELNSVYSEGIEYALTGYYRHASAVTQREIFLGKLDNVLSTLNALGANEDLNEVKTSLKALRELIDTTSDNFHAGDKTKIQTKYVGGDDEKTSILQRAREAIHGLPDAIRSTGSLAKDTSLAIQDAARDAADAKRNVMSASSALMGGDEDYEDDVSGGAVPASSATLQAAGKSLKYFLDVAKMRENLKKVSSEAPKYNANYESVLGDALGKLIDDEMKKYNEFEEDLARSSGPGGYVRSGQKIPLAEAYKLIEGALKRAGERGYEESKALEGWSKESILSFQQKSRDAKIDLFKALQAIDMYLLNFTDAITANPDDVKEMAKLLDSTEVIADWFNDMSGDSIAAVFEFMPWAIHLKDIGSGRTAIDTKLSPLGYTAPGAVKSISIVDAEEGRLKSVGKHYYESVVQCINEGKAQPGNPFLVISPQRALYARDFARKTVERMLALKNIVTVFSFMGTKAGRSSGVSGGADVGMTPAQIYRALMNYLYISAFTMGWDGYDASVQGSVPEKQAFAMPYRPSGDDIVSATGIMGEADVSASANPKVYRSTIVGGVLMGVMPLYNQAGETWGSSIGDDLLYKERAADPISGETQRRTGWSQLETKATTTIGDMKTQLAALATERKAVEAAAADAKQALALALAAQARGPPSTGPPMGPPPSAPAGGPPSGGPPSGGPQPPPSRPPLTQVTAEQLGTGLRAEIQKVTASNDPGQLSKLPYLQAVLGKIDTIIADEKNLNDMRNKDPADPNISALQAKIDADKAALNANDLNRTSYQVAGGAGGGAKGWETTNWVDYCNSLELKDPKGSRDWKIAFNLPSRERDLMKDVPPFTKAAFGCAMNSIAYEEGTAPAWAVANAGQKTVGGWHAGFMDADTLFVHAIKSMVAKVCTVSGLFNMLNYAPSEKYHTMSATRMIIGGGSAGGQIVTPANSLIPTSVPPVYDEAVELYLRLPLLVEFYRDIFSMDQQMKDNMASDDVLVALVPEMDLSWSSLMRLSFDSSSIGGAVITKNYAARMIAEINAVYDKYKSRGSGSLVSAVVNDFIADVNSRFGIMTRLEMRKYVEFERQARSSLSVIDEEDVRDYNTLHEDGAEPVMHLPSDKYSKITGTSSTSAERNEFKMSFIGAIRKFRQRIEDSIRNAVYDGTTVKSDIPSFFEQARITRASLKTLSSPEQRFNAMYAAMAGIDSMQNLNENANIMFHELVMAPLAVLKGIQSTLSAFIANVNDLTTRALAEVAKPPPGADASKMNDIFSELVRLLISHVSSMSGLVEVDTAGSKLVINYSKLGQYCEDTLAFVRAVVHKFRGYLPDALVDQYERRSIEVIQHDLMDTMFRGEYALNADARKATLDYAVRQVTRMFAIFSGEASAYRLPDEPDPVAKNLGSISYGSALRPLIYYDPDNMTSQSRFMGPGQVEPVLTREDKLGIFMTAKAEVGKQRIFDDVMFASRWNIYLDKDKGGFRGDRPERRGYSDDGKLNTTARYSDADEGLMMRMNEVLARYLEQFTDAKNKIYKPAIEGFVGAAHGAVMESNGWPDLVAPMNTYGESLVEGLNVSGINGKSYPVYDMKAFIESGVITAPPNPTWAQRVASIAVRKPTNLMASQGSDYLTVLERECATVAVPDPVLWTTFATNIVLLARNSLISDFGNMPAWTLPQAINIIRHAFDRASVYARLRLKEEDVKAVADAYNAAIHAKATPEDALTASEKAHDVHIDGKMAIINGVLTKYRDSIIENTSKKWTVLGPIAPIIASIYYFQYIHPDNVSAPGPKIPGGLFSDPSNWRDDNTPVSEASLAARVKEPLDLLNKAVATANFYAAAQRGQRADGWGNPDEVVFASLGKAVRTMMTEQEKTGVYSFLISEGDKSELDMTMRDNFRANMPIFRKMFGAISVASGILSKIIALPKFRSSVDVPKISAGARAKQVGVHGHVFGNGYANNTDMLVKDDVARRYFTKILDKITATCNSVISCANKVMGEIDDNPVYLEVREGSIADYRNTSNVNPFMPPSTILAALASVNKRDPSLMMPTNAIGSESFGFNYGTRLVLGQPNMIVMLDHMPGMREIADNYNKTVNQDKQISAENINLFLSKYMQLVRWITDVRVYSNFANGATQLSEFGMMNSTDAGEKLPYQLAQLTLDQALGLTTSSDKKSSVTAVAEWVSSSSAARSEPLSRAKVQVYNLLDLNVNPINMNALRREVPLINMLNYSFTFDAFARDMIGNNTFVIPAMGDKAAPKFNYAPNDPKAYLHLLLHPHAMKTTVAWPAIQAVYAQTANIFSGRDRFAYDQVITKALLCDDVEEGAKPFAAAKALPGQHLKYRSKKKGADPSTVVADVSTQYPYLEILGQMRHDTTFIRNILFISSAHRLMREKMSQALTVVYAPVVSGTPIVDRKITEEYPWETFNSR
jgi:hypothetical protein